MHWQEGILCRVEVDSIRAIAMLQRKYLTFWIRHSISNDEISNNHPTASHRHSPQITTAPFTFIITNAAGFHHRGTGDTP